MDEPEQSAEQQDGAEEPLSADVSQVDVSEILSKGIHEDAGSQSEPEPEEDVPESPEADSDAEKPDETAQIASPEDEKPAEEEPEEEKKAPEPRKKLTPRQELSHRLARKRNKEADRREAELERRFAELEQRQAQFEQARSQETQTQQQFIARLREDPVGALKSVGEDPDHIIQQFGRQLLDSGEATHQVQGPQPWVAQLKKMEDRFNQWEQARAQEAQQAQEQAEQRQLINHQRGVVTNMVSAPAQEQFEGRWPVFERLTPQHRMREAAGALQTAYEQGFEGQIHELLDHLEVTLAEEYPYLNVGNGAGNGEQSGRDGATRGTETKNPPGNGDPDGEIENPAATPDAVTSDMTAESGSSGKGRALTERQRAAKAARILAEGIIRE